MPSEEQFGELWLVDYVRAVARRKRIVISSVVAIVVSVLLLSVVQTPRYTATAEVLLEPSQTGSLFDARGQNQAADPQRFVQTQIKVFKSAPVRAAVRTKLGSAPPVSVIAESQTDVVSIRSSSTDPKLAQDTANVYANSYIEVRRTAAVNSTVDAAQQIQGRIAELQRQVNALDKASLSERDSLIAQQTPLKEKLDQLQVDGALTNGGAQLVTAASRPTSPSTPRPVRNSVLALFAGLILGSGLALLVDHLDDSLNTRQDLERAVPGVPVVGVIPSVAGSPAEVPTVISVTQPTSSAAEAYRTLRTSVQFLNVEETMQIVHITSPSAAEGKTTTLANLGVALARSGQRVVIVCCDLRRPRVHEFFGLHNTTGFTSVLLGKVPLLAGLQEVPGVPRLRLIASGPLPPNPSELLSSRRTADLLASLRSEADMVLVDSPPVLPVTDSLVLSRLADATLLVCVAGSTSSKDASRARELLVQVDAALVGTVFNGATDNGAYGYEYDQALTAPSVSASPTASLTSKRTWRRPSNAS